MPLARRRMLQLAAAFSLAGAAALLPATTPMVMSSAPPLPESVVTALRTLEALGFDDLVAVYRNLRPTIEIQPPETFAYGGLTEGLATSTRRSASIKLRADLESSPATLAAILAHELLHVWQFAYQPDVYASCPDREIAAYRVQATVLRAWCTANPADRYSLPVSDMSLMSVVEYGYPETLPNFAVRASCSIG